MQHGVAVTILQAVELDRHGDPIEGTGRSVVEDGWAFSPRGSSESHDAANTVINGLMGYGPYGSAIRHDSVVVVNGDHYEVEGEPGRWRNPMTGDEMGCQVALTRQRG